MVVNQCALLSHSIPQIAIGKSSWERHAQGSSHPTIGWLMMLKQQQRAENTAQHHMRLNRNLPQKNGVDFPKNDQTRVHLPLVGYTLSFPTHRSEPSLRPVVPTSRETNHQSLSRSWGTHQRLVASQF